MLFILFSPIYLLQLTEAFRTKKLNATIAVTGFQRSQSRFFRLGVNFNVMVLLTAKFEAQISPEIADDTISDTILKQYTNISQHQVSDVGVNGKNF